jgi:hypothetical protein
MKRRPLETDAIKHRFIKLLDDAKCFKRLQMILIKSNDDVFLKALTIVLERGLGRPVTPIEHSGGITLEQILCGAEGPE